MNQATTRRRRVIRATALTSAALLVLYLLSYGPVTVLARDRAIHRAATAAIQEGAVGVGFLPYDASELGIFAPLHWLRDSCPLMYELDGAYVEFWFDLTANQTSVTDPIAEQERDGTESGGRRLTQ